MPAVSRGALRSHGPHPSLSRSLQTDGLDPSLLHSLRHDAHSSVLSLASSDQYIFSGSQSEDISVWSKSTFTLKDTLRGHTGSVLALTFAKEKDWLFSSSGDSTIRVWNTETLTPIYIVNPYLETESGDLFSLIWSPSLQTIYIGCQNTSIQWIDFKAVNSSSSSVSAVSGALGTITPTTVSIARKAHKFFDSYPQYERKAADLLANNGSTSPPSHGLLGQPVLHLQIPQCNVVDSAHYGYVYAMAIIENPDLEPERVQLITGGGDETLKVWHCAEDSVPTLLYEHQCENGAIYAIVARGQTVFAGCQDGCVKVFDLETRTLVRRIIGQENVDILSMTLIDSDLYACFANGRIHRYSSSFDLTASWDAHEGIVLSSIATSRNRENAERCLISGGNDDQIKIWDMGGTIDMVASPSTDLRISKSNSPSLLNSGKPSPLEKVQLLKHGSDTLIYALTKFVSIPSVSQIPSRREDCRQAAIWLKKCLSQLGADVSLLPVGVGVNPLVHGVFQGQQSTAKRPRILFYGHYDVIAAPMIGWKTDPFKLTGLNGYLYGRGVTDDKGPILAVACAAAELLSQRRLGVDIVFLVEGEEECGSTGFEDAVKKYKDLIGPIDAIFVSNSTWIAEDEPCITYGLRGVVHCSVEISNDMPDLHSGVEGGAVAEPMTDLINVLSTLTDVRHKVLIPGFYKQVRAQTPEGAKLYEKLAQITKKPASSLSSRWREPSLTVHNVEISGPRNATVIPGSVKAQISVRIVPDQELDTIVESLRNHLTGSFAILQSPNTFKVHMEHTADWWLGDLEDSWSQALQTAVADEWGVEPLRIREGGSIPSIPYLEKEFGCRALHLPLGQSSDQAHLPNERISLVNLQKGKSVIERFLLKVAELSASGSLV